MTRPVANLDTLARILPPWWGARLKPAPLWQATVSVIALGEPPKKREYFAEG